MGISSILIRSLSHGEETHSINNRINCSVRPTNYAKRDEDTQRDWVLLQKLFLGHGGSNIVPCRAYISYLVTQKFDGTMRDRYEKQTYGGLLMSDGNQ